MAKKNGSIMYKCSSCGYTHPKWLGRCPACEEWNTLCECVIDEARSSVVAQSRAETVALLDVKSEMGRRVSLGINEFDRVLGGGAEVSSAILIGGEPGIGKSTLLMQASSFVKNVLYVSGEEAAAQIKERAERLSVNQSGVSLLCTMRLEDILLALDKKMPDLVIVDSIQTVYSTGAGLIPGTVNQLKYCANELIQWVKERESILVMSAHVTKEGLIAGPKSLEHMVDTVISFEHASDDYRFLRAMKNRFGSVDEIGIFEMTESGLVEVSDPSNLFITRREGAAPSGVVCSSVFEGSRVFMVEVQALTVPAKGSLSRVYSDKIETNRVARVAAVLEKKLGLKFSDQDIYINVAGGIRLTESAVDAALAAALYSARTDIAVKDNIAVIGELSLAGEVRPVRKLSQRVKTAHSMGFSSVFAPEDTDGAVKVKSVKDLVLQLFG